MRSRYSAQAGISIVSVIIAMFIVTFAIVAGSKTILNYLEITNRVRGKDLLSQVEDVVRLQIETKMGDYMEEMHAQIEAEGSAELNYDTGQYTTLPNCASTINLDDIVWGQPTSYFSMSLVKDEDQDSPDAPDDLRFTGEPAYYSAALNRCAEANQKLQIATTEERLFFCLKVNPVGTQQQRSVLEKGPMLVEVSYTLWDTALGTPLACSRFFESHTRAAAIVYRMYWRTANTGGKTSLMQSTTSSMVAKTHS